MVLSVLTSLIQVIWNVNTGSACKYVLCVEFKSLSYCIQYNILLFLIDM
jgi:hypothetical protein